MDFKKILILPVFIAHFLVQAQVEKIDKLLKINQEAPGAAIAVYHNGKYIYDKAFGMANLDYDTPIDENTVFEVGSLAMHITASCILKLEDEKKLSLNDDIRKHLNDLPNYKEGTVTIINLLNHTSGIMDYLIGLNMSGKSWKTPYTNEDAYALIKRKTSLGFPPGQEYEYSNSNYLLLSEIISRVSGKPHWEYAKQEIFEPLGMSSTFYYSSANQLVKNRAIGYQKTEDTFEVNHNYDFSAYGDGRLYTSLSDLKKWADNLQKDSSPIKNLEQRLTQQNMRNNGEKLSYALGLEHGVEKGHPFFAHSGYWAGFSAMFLKFTEIDLWVISLSNNGSISGPNNAYDVAGVILESYPKKEQLAKRYQVKRKKLEDYEGNYFGYKNGYVREIKIVNDTLNYIESESRIYKLQPIAKDKFKVLGTITNYTIDFQSDANDMNFLRNGLVMYSYKKYNPVTSKDWNTEWNGLLGTYKNEDLALVYELKKGKEKGIDVFVNNKKLMNYLPVMEGLFSSESTHHGYLKFTEEGEQFTLNDYSFKPMKFKRVLPLDESKINQP